MVINMSSTTADDSDLEAANEKPQPGNPRTHDYLDGLRGFAAFVVYVSHSVIWWYGTDSEIEHGFGYNGEYHFATFPFIRTLYSGGAAAVAIFFVMSGFVLSITPLSMIDDRSELRKYLIAAAIRRPFRLYLPVAAISLIFALCMHLPFGLAPHLEWPAPEPTLLAELWRWARELCGTMNIFRAHSPSDHWFPYDPPAWTMAAELKGSLAVYLMLACSAFLPAIRRPLLFLITALILLFTYQWELSCFMFGVYLALLNTKSEPEQPTTTLSPPIKLRFPISPAFFSTLQFFLAWFLLGQPHGSPDPNLTLSTPLWHTLSYLIPPPYNTPPNEPWRFFNTLAAALLLHALLNLPTLQTAVFRRKPLRFLGKVSFSFYLIHIPLIWTVADRVARALGSMRQDFETAVDGLVAVPDWGPLGLSLGFLCWQAVTVPVVLGLATVATRRIDEPSVAVGKWVAGKVGFGR